MNLQNSDTKHKKVILRGLGTSSGNVSGNCRVIYNMQQLDQIKEGEILVAPTINPEIILSISKCSAIITDIGGMVSHAAIIAREFGIPCVVGTEIATKVLKNGMNVEVDGTKGIVILQEQSTQIRESKDEFVIFGNKVKPKQLRIVRRRPVWSKIWIWGWPEITFDVASWIVPRPDIHGSFVQRSLVASAMESIPYALGFDDIGPLYVLYHDNLYVHFDKVRAIKERLEIKLLGRDISFWKNFVDELDLASAEFNSKSKNLIEFFEKTHTLENLIDVFEEWWGAHNRFFSLTYFIQPMGDDIVWLKIREMLGILKDENKALEYMKILSSPLTDDEVITSLQFAQDTFNLLRKADESIQKTLQSNIDEFDVIKTLKETSYGKEWINKLTNHCKKWGWLRQGDLYYRPIVDKITMLRFIRKSSTTEIIIDLSKNKQLFKKVTTDLLQKFPSNEYEEFMFYVNVGRFLQRARDNHHYIWIKNTNIVHELIIKFGEELQKQEFIDNKMDVFFLTVPEILCLVEKTALVGKKTIKEKINQRIAHLAKVSKTSFHRDVNIAVVPDSLDGVF